MSKKRRKKQTARQAPRTAQAAKKSDTKSRPEPKKKAVTAAGNARRWVWPIAIVALVAIALLVSQTLFGQDKNGPTGPWTLTILHTTDVEGYLDPCG